MRQDSTLKCDNNGSITVFFCLILAVYLSLSMVLLESARIYGMQWMAQEMTNHAVDSVMAEWNREVKEQYGLYLLDTGYGSKQQQLGVSEERFLKYASQLVRMPNGGNLFHVEIEDAQIVQVISAMDVTQFQKGIENVLEANQVEQWSDFFTENQDIVKSETQMEQSETSIQEQFELWEQFQESEAGEENDTQEDVGEKQNTEEKQDTEEKQEIEQKQEIEEKTSCHLVYAVSDDTDRKSQLNYRLTGLSGKLDEITLKSIVPSNRTVSEAALKDADTLPSRLLDAADTSVSWMGKQKLYFNAYVGEKFTCFTDEVSQKSMQYQMEYILYAQETDKENLALAVKHLLLLRSALNLVQIQTSPEKEMQVQALATTLTAWNPAAAALPAVVFMLENLWAWAEAKRDVVILLSGGEVSIYKGDAQWYYSLENVLNGMDYGSDWEENTSGQGLNYKQYLSLLLFAKDATKSAMRAMDMIQDSLQEKIPNFYYQNMVVGMAIESTVLGKHQFSVRLNRGGRYQWTQKAQRKYGVKKRT